MAKKTHVKVRLVPESKPDSPFFYYVKKPAGGEKAKIKLKAKKYNPATRKHEVFVEKNFLLTVNNYFFKISFRSQYKTKSYFSDTISNFRVNLICYRFFSDVF